MGPVTFPRSQVDEGGSSCWVEQRTFSTAGPRPTSLKAPPPSELPLALIRKHWPSNPPGNRWPVPACPYMSTATSRLGSLLSPLSLCHLLALSHRCLPSFSASLRLKCVGIITCGVVQEASSPSIIATDAETQEQMSSNSYVAARQNKTLY